MIEIRKWLLRFNALGSFNVREAPEISEAA
jgi:hypothetical protein